MGDYFCEEGYLNCISVAQYVTFRNCYLFHPSRSDHSSVTDCHSSWSHIGPLFSEEEIEKEVREVGPLLQIVQIKTG